MQHIQYVAGGYLKTVTNYKQFHGTVVFDGRIGERQYPSGRFNCSRFEIAEIEEVHRQAIWNNVIVGDFLYDKRAGYWLRVKEILSLSNIRAIKVECYKWDPAIEKPFDDIIFSETFFTGLSVIVRPADSSDHPHDIVRRLPQRVNSGGYLSVQLWLESYGVNVIGEL